MDPLTLTIDRDDEVSLPIALITSARTSDEIVALFLFCAIQKLGDLPESFANRLADQGIKAAGNTLRAKGILTASANGNTVSLEVDMDAAVDAA